MKYANYANYLIKYAFYRETPGLIEFYRKNYMRLNLGTFDTPRHKILTGFPLSISVTKPFKRNNILIFQNKCQIKLYSTYHLPTMYQTCDIGPKLQILKKKLLHNHSNVTPFIFCVYK